MFSYIRRSLLLHKSCVPYGLRFVNKVSLTQDQKSGTLQLEHLKQFLENRGQNWTELKNTILNTEGKLNENNVDAIMLKFMVNHKKFDAALLFVSYLKNNKTLNLGSTNSLLHLYYELGKTNELSDKQKDFILEIYKELYSKYKVLDYTTSERLLHALCVINEWEKAFRVLDEIHHSGIPSHLSYSLLIATLFRINKKTEAFNLIQSSLNNKRPLQFVAYAEWINYILRKYKTKKTIVKYLDEICLHISRNCTTIDLVTAKKMVETYTSLGWSAQLTAISRQTGHCKSCNETLQCLKLTKDEFHELQRNVKEKLIVGSDLFLKTSPSELQRFLSFIEKTAPYDIVLDGLNIALAAGFNNAQRIYCLKMVVDQFKRENKRILLLGRKHMLKWPRQPLDYLRKNTFSFFTEDLTQDDPYFITAAILSGSDTDIVSKDLLRGHRFLLKDEHLQHLFKRWQWQHQWMVFANKGRPQIMPPLKFTPLAQKHKEGWHLPYEKEDQKQLDEVNTGLPDITNWLCLKPNPGVNK